jgi:DNA-directed RNA polymerase subunit beta
MAYSYTEKKRIRKNFGKLPTLMDVPYLLAIQVDSYRAFLQDGKLPRSVKTSVCRRHSSRFFRLSAIPAMQHWSLSNTIWDTRFDVRECILRGLTYAAPLRVKIRLIIYDREASVKTIKDIREQEVYMGEIPLMTDNGTFVINGTERVIVSQLHRSRACSLITTKARHIRPASCCITHASFLTAALGWTSSSTPRIWFVRIDRRRKLPATILLRALGYSVGRNPGHVLRNQ